MTQQIKAKNLEDYVKQSGRKIKVLWFSDTPTCATGFGNVARNVLKILNKTGLFEFDIVGINYDGTPYDKDKYPYAIFPALNALKANNQGYNDLYGRQQLLDLLGEGRYDLLFTLQDTFIVAPMVDHILQTKNELPLANKFKWIFYFPVDATPPESWIKQYAYEECIKKDKSLKDKLKVIYHGTNLEDFHPIDDKEAKKIREGFFLKENADKFIFMNLNRNQPRKDINRTMRAFSILHKERPNTFLYLHCQAVDAGGNLFEIDKQYGLKIAKDWSCPNPEMFQANQGYPIHILNGLYNAVDAVVSTTLGEGWGLSYTESFATKRPLIAPDNTSVPEIIGEQGERGLKVKSGSDDNLWSPIMGGDNERFRPLTDVYDMVEKMKYVIDNPEKVKAMVVRAYEWVKKYSWESDNVGGHWVELFKQSAWDNLVARGVVKTEKIGRNEPCPCGSNKKFKRCCLNKK